MPCLNTDPDRLYELIPVVYRLRDADQGYPLKALLRVIAEQVNIVEKDIAGLYDNWFIETCADWVVPYIGTLLDYIPVHDAGEPTAGGTQAAQARNRILFPRQEVANLVRFRRRKGTLSVLEDIARATSGWPLRAVEIYRQLGFTQNISYPHMNRGRLVDLRDGDALDQLRGAFNESARTIDVRSRGWNLPQVRVFVWRLRSYSITRTSAFHYDEGGPNAYLFNPLGIDTQLFIAPQPASGSPGPLNVPAPITQRSLVAFEASESSGAQPGVPFYYGAGKSFQIWTGDPMQPVPAKLIVPADLGDWSYRPVAGQVAVDPERGRIVFPPLQGRRPAVWVSYNYGFSADMAGGEYPRQLKVPPGARTYLVGAGEPFRRIDDALTQWKTDQPSAAVIEITDSGVYIETLQIDLAQNQQLVIQAASGSRPVIRLTNLEDGSSGALSVTGAQGSWLSLDGIVLLRSGLQIDGDMSGVVLRHCTLVPGLALTCNCEPTRPGEPSIEVDGGLDCLRIDHSITGMIRVNRDQTAYDPLRLRITDSILDATRLDQPAVFAPDSLCAHAVLEIQRSTILGKLAVRAIQLAENAIVMGTVLVCRRQQGCVRFSYIPPGSRTPRRFECQPDLVEAAVRAQFANGDLTPQERDLLIARERLRVTPEFNSTRYGDAGYCRLAATCAIEITRGAEDQSEMGAFHDLFQPQRAANLKARLAEFTPAGAEVSVEFIT